MEINKVTEDLASKKAELNNKISETRALTDKEDSSIEEIEKSLKETRALDDKVKELQREIDVFNEASQLTRASEVPANSSAASSSATSSSVSSASSEGSGASSASTSSSASSASSAAPAKSAATRDDEDKDDDDSSDDSDVDDDDKEDRSKKRNLEGVKNLKNLTKDEKKKEQVRGLEDYIRSHGEKRDGVVSGDVGAMIPEQIIYDPSAEVDSVVDLSTLVTKTPVSTASGKYPILNRATAKMSTVAELAENPDLAKPDFNNVAWAVETYRGAIPISEESLADTQVPLLPVIQKNAGEQRINTLNAIISAKLETFTAKASTADTLVDDLKHILNVDLDPAYNKSIVVSQSAYQTLDTLKDKEGRYLLQDTITSATGKAVMGYTVTVVNDELLGKAGEAHIWIGDLKRAILFANRLDTQIQWNKSEIYGQYLALVMRFDVEVADAKAGYLVTVGDATAPAAKTGN